MTKHLINIALLLCLFYAGNSSAQTLKLKETFDSLNAESRGWQFINRDSNMVDYPVLYSPFTFTDAGLLNAEEGNYFISYNSLNANESGLIDEWVISPGVVIEKYDRLSFWCGAVDKNYKDTLRVLVSSTGTSISDFTEIDRFKVDGPAGSWHRKAYDLSRYAGKTIHFAVNYHIKDGGVLGSNSDNVWIDNFSIESAFGPEADVENYELEQNYPNPFNPSTNIIFSVKFDSDVEIKIYDVLGRQTEVLINRNFKAGRYNVEWNAANYSSGTYFYQIKAVSGNTTFEDTKQMILVK